ncbi:TFIIH basal transcription factor complex helicase repB subunit [Porphyridium purpureum]|uniref:DNA 3'-5' helicase n=1 Tax=Porphyridium purpureum TaxID=35688 RepID=A0A5J4YX37_PORPP|nr:TFIIH basal transcription factor complex helicase repB subunit [Porphyridium purpureum]|eukprot:POR0558..scf209_3
MGPSNNGLDTSRQGRTHVAGLGCVWMAADREDEAVGGKAPDQERAAVSQRAQRSSSTRAVEQLRQAFLDQNDSDDEASSQDDSLQEPQDVRLQQNATGLLKIFVRPGAAAGGDHGRKEKKRRHKVRDAVFTVENDDEEYELSEEDDEDAYRSDDELPDPEERRRRRELSEARKRERLAQSQQEGDTLQSLDRVRHEEVHGDHAASGDSSARVDSKTPVAVLDKTKETVDKHAAKRKRLAEAALKTESAALTEGVQGEQMDSEEMPMPSIARDFFIPDSFLGGDEDLPEGMLPSFVDSAVGIKLKPDHTSRPVWVAKDGRIFLETFSPIYKQAYDFLVAIAEPVSRPELIQEYRLTPYALYAAVSVGLDADTIVAVLGRLCKTALPPEVPDLIKSCTKTFGKSKLVLHRGKYYIQTTDEDVLKLLLQDAVIQEARVQPDGESFQLGLDRDRNPLGGVVLSGGDTAVTDDAAIDAVFAALENEDDDDDDYDEDVGSGATNGNKDESSLMIQKSSAVTRRTKPQSFFSLEIKGENVEFVKRRCIELDYPLMEEYDFRNDTVNKTLAMDLKPIAKVRPYQEKSLAKMFGNGRARSGVIVLPCGAGKSLVGVTAACTIKKPTLCLCTSSVSVEQWRHQFALWSTLPKDQIGRFTAGAKGNMLHPVTVTTYSMISHSGKRSAETTKLLDQLKAQEWGLILLDEVHVVPANVFRRVLGVVKAHCKLGLTATLLREDHKIGDINFLIGPKLYEANWLDLQRAGYLATVQCAEVWCPMTAEFYDQYLKVSSAKRKLLYAMNPNKFRMTQYLVRFHEARGDKIIIFSDNIFALRLYAERLRRPFIYGPTSQQERTRILYQFQNNPQLGTILLSKVGDTSIDIPEANVLIQVSSHYGSRRQEAQRLGRILRPKPRAGQNFNAFFYSLVSADTQEMYYSSKRQQFLIDQGYAFKVITELTGMESVPDLAFSTREEQLELLTQVLNADEAEATEKTDDPDADELGIDRINGGATGSRRMAAGLGALSGADGMRYAEYQNANQVLGRGVVRHQIFRKRFANR